jgi:carbon-monoxide dehydrogenase small subunit
MTEPVAAEVVDVVFTVNGERHYLSVRPGRTLADVLRADLGLTGTHLSCEVGVCGVCTVLVDGDPVRACLVLAAQADGATILTVEGLAADGELSPLQRAFRDAHGLQCGFCTPGFLTLLSWYLEGVRGMPSEADIREIVSSNLCRCTGYQGIVDAVRLAAARRNGAG